MAQPDQHHLGGGTAIGRGFHFADAFQQHLPGARQGGHAQPVGEGGATGPLILRQFGAVPQTGNGFQPSHDMQQFQQILEDRAQIGATLIRLIGDRQGGSGLAAHHRLQQVEHRVAVRLPQHLRHLPRADHPLRLGDGLIEHGQTIPHRAIRRARDQIEGGGLDLHALLAGDAGEMGMQFRDPHAAEVETLAARQDRDRHLAGLGRGEDEFHMRRRFLQRLQQRVEGVARQHVDLVDDEDLGARLHGTETGRLDDLPHIIDAGAGGGVHLHHVRMPVGQDANAVGAYSARIGDRSARPVEPGAVQRAGDDAGGGGFADPAHPGQHEGMRDPSGGEGVAQDAHHRLLPDQIVERRGTVFARQHPIGRRMHRRGRHAVQNHARPR